MIDLAKQLLEQHGGTLVSALTERAGFSPDQARSFLPAAVQKVLGLVQGGGLDVGQLLAGDASAVTSKLDPAELAAEAGVAPEQARSGLEALVPQLGSLLSQQAGGPAELLGMLGGGKPSALGGAAKLAGKLFGR